MDTHGTRAEIVSLKDLGHAVSRAIDAAGHQNVGGAGPIIKRWDIMGRILREMAEGERFAHDVANQLNHSGHQVAPATLAIDGHILAGFIERRAIPQQYSVS
jgi:hypothetical protein